MTEPTSFPTPPLKVIQQWALSPECPVSGQQRYAYLASKAIEWAMTTTEPTNWQALCAELVDELEGWIAYGDEADIADAHSLVDRARAALSQPEPEGATDEELLQIAAETSSYESCGIAIGEYEAETECVVEMYGSELIAFARAVLARWGRRAIEPVPVSERPILKSSNFNDANGHCWCGTSASVDETGDLSVEMPPSWELREPCAQDDCVLPHHALPVPTAH